MNTAGDNVRFRTVIGLEIHVQLQTKSKMFCSCSADVFDASPNTHICPVCTGQPGALPVVNGEAVRLAVLTALALNCRVNLFSRFDRKNYFYPDLPKGYQITQYFYPLAERGHLTIEDDEGNEKVVRIRRIHLEEDAGKLFHEEDKSLVDLNRCGVPLIEIVTEPDIASPAEARRFMEELRAVVRHLGVSSGDMEKGALRCDANISVEDVETGRKSNRVEVKNINSFRFVEKALEFEFERIKKALEGGKNVEKETRGWDMKTRTTISMRSKEEEADYRYFPEPDLPPLVLKEEFVKNLEHSLPELPRERALRLSREYGIPLKEAKIYALRPSVADFFEEAAGLYGDPKTVSNWILSEILRELKEEGEDRISLTPAQLVELLRLLDEGTISTRIAKELLPEMISTGKSAKRLVEEKGLSQIDDESLIRDILQRAIQENPDVVEKYRSGKKQTLGFFVGFVMKETRGKANPAVVNRIARELLDQDL
ncbi:MAG: aspartyl-tRNA(Asn)/glutamyl-tRNA(Gln) amidotransferase subunit [Thermotogota bacterium]|nr:aspartyl-tRNA(Asn)/glutamyl-tRNA(Gln) amidotransferase subunit [Thermotogota bacterium]